MYGFKEISKELGITETQAKSKLKKAGYGINDKIDESQFKLLKMSNNSNKLPGKTEVKVEPPRQDERPAKQEGNVTLQSLVTDELPLENLLEVAELLQLDVNAISPEDSEILTELTQNSIQLDKIQKETEDAQQKREKIRNQRFQIELESSQLTGELNALLHHKIGEIAYEKKMLELEETNLKQLESKSHDFQSQLLRLMPKDDVIDVEAASSEEKNNRFLKLGKVRLKLLSGG
jgi:hypothetical protein